MSSSVSDDTRWREVEAPAFGPMPGRSFCRPRVGIVWQLDGRVFGFHVDGAAALVSGPDTWRVFLDRAEAWRWLGLGTELVDELDALVDEALAPSDLAIAAERALMATPQADLRAVAARLGVSSRTLQRALEARKLTFQALRGRIRLDLALQLLARSEVTVRAVARAVGFESIGHFIVWFRQQRGVTPGAYRASLKPA